MFGIRGILIGHWYFVRRHNLILNLSQGNLTVWFNVNISQNKIKGETFFEIVLSYVPCNWITLSHTVRLEVITNRGVCFHVWTHWYLSPETDGSIYIHAPWSYEMGNAIVSAKANVHISWYTRHEHATVQRSWWEHRLLARKAHGLWRGTTKCGPIK